MPHLQYDEDESELFEVFDPMDALYDHLDTIDAVPPGEAQLPLIRAFFQYLHTIPTFLATNPGFRTAILESALQSQNALQQDAHTLAQYICGLRNRDDFIDW